MSASTLNRPPTALVTGTTGMIGAEVMATLMDHGWRVRALVRAADRPMATRRLTDRLHEADRADLIPYLDGTALTALPGDVTRDGLGLSEDDLATIDGISALVHCAAETSFKPEAPTDEINVGGTQNVLALARTLAPSPRLIHISTAYVQMGPFHTEIAEDEASATAYDNNYVRSKREAERLVRDSDLDAAALRPSIVLNRTHKDRRMRRSILWVIPAMAQLGDVPVDADARLDIVPARYVAEAVDALLRRPELHHRCYHVTAGPQASRTIAEICDAAAEILPAAGRIRFQGSGEGLSRQAEDRHAQRFMAQLAPYLPFIEADVVYTSKRLRDELGADTPVCPPITEYLPHILTQASFAEPSL